MTPNFKIFHSNTHTKKIKQRWAGNFFTTFLWGIFTSFFWNNVKSNEKNFWLINYIGAGYKGTTNKGLSPNFNWNLRESKHINFFLHHPEKTEKLTLYVLEEIKAN